MTETPDADVPRDVQILVNTLRSELANANDSNVQLKAQIALYEEQIEYLQAAVQSLSHSHDEVVEETLPLDSE